MMIRCLGKVALPLLALAVLSACQPAPYRSGYARPAYAAAPSCSGYQYSPPSNCYQQPVRYASPRPSCAPAYRYSRPASGCAPAYRQRGYRYVTEGYAPDYGPVYAGRYRPLRPNYLPYPAYRPPRYRPIRDYYWSSCCY